MKPWMYLVIGIGLFGGGIYSFLSTRDFIGEAATTGGVVIDLEREQDADGNDSYYPRVQFETNGRSINSGARLVRVAVRSRSANR